MIAQKGHLQVEVDQQGTGHKEMGDLEDLNRGEGSANNAGEILDHRKYN